MSVAIPSPAAETLAPRRDDELFSVRIAPIWKFVRSQPISFWLACAYLFIEYVRPQTRFPAIDVIPWGKTVVILGLIAVVMEHGLPRFRTIAGPLMVLFTVIVLLSSVFAFRSDVAFEEISLYLSWLLVYLVITNAITTEKRFFVFMLIFLLASFKLSQGGARSWAMSGFAWRDWGIWGPEGWFNNPGELGIQMCVFLPIAGAFVWGFRERWGRIKNLFFMMMPITALITIVGSNSRGAIVGACAVFAWWMLFVSRRVRTLMLLVVVVGGGYLLVPDEQIARFETAGEDGTSINRTTRWADGIEMMNANPVFGIGYANWYHYYSAYYPQRPGHGLSHNIFVEAGSELGYSGLITFLLLIGATFELNRRTRKIARRFGEDDRFLLAMGYGLDGGLVGYIGSGFWVTVLFYPYFWINLAMTVSLHLAARHKAAELQRLGAGASRGGHSAGGPSGRPPAVGHLPQSSRPTGREVGAAPGVVLPGGRIPGR